jgi:hypothetical protein
MTTTPDYRLERRWWCCGKLCKKCQYPEFKKHTCSLVSSLLCMFFFIATICFFVWTVFHILRIEETQTQRELYSIVQSNTEWYEKSCPTVMSWDDATLWYKTCGNSTNNRTAVSKSQVESLNVTVALHTTTQIQREYRWLTDLLPPAATRLFFDIIDYTVFWIISQKHSCQAVMIAFFMFSLLYWYWKRFPARHWYALKDVWGLNDTLVYRNTIPGGISTVSVEEHSLDSLEGQSAHTSSSPSTLTRQDSTTFHPLSTSLRRRLQQQQ